jgi:hypothetical protein
MRGLFFDIYLFQASCAVSITVTRSKFFKRNFLENNPKAKGKSTHQVIKNLCKNDEKALEKEEQRRFDLLNSTQKETTEMKINAHKLSKKIDYLKASLFENNLEILESIDSDKVSLLAKDTDKLKPLTVNWSKVIDNSESLSISDPVSLSDKVSIESSLNEKENTFSDNKLDNSSNTLIETKNITSQEDQPIIQSRSARNMARTPLRSPINVNGSSLPIPSAPKEPKKN